MSVEAQMLPLVRAMACCAACPPIARSYPIVVAPTITEKSTYATVGSSFAANLIYHSGRARTASTPLSQRRG